MSETKTIEGITLKHLAPYLPYGLKYISYSGSVLNLNCEHVLYLINTKGKPILRNLSEITKEIEVNGERFVPIQWFEDQEYYDWDNIKFMDYINHNTLPYCWIQKLYEWHFAIGIPEHLYININDLQK